MSRAVEVRKTDAGLIGLIVRYMVFMSRYRTELRMVKVLQLAALAQSICNAILLELHLGDFLLFFHLDPFLLGWAEVYSTALLLLVDSQNRALIWSKLIAARRARVIARAFTACGGPLATLPPFVVSSQARPFGWVMGLSLKAGTCLTDLQRAEELLATALKVRSVKAVGEGNNASEVSLYCYVSDPLVATMAIHPSRTGSPTSVWEPVGIGVNESGGVEYLSLIERNVLIGGEPGSGKSVALSVLISQVALDPQATLYLLDGKVVELACWRACADGYVGADVAEAVKLLSEIASQMAYRYEVLLSLGKRKIEPSMGLAPIVVAIDELAHYLNHPDKASRTAFAEVLRDLVSRGRAAGIIVVAATQKPASDVVPTAVRDLFSFRFAFRCSTKEASDTILGSGWATEGFSASSIDPGSRGVGYLLHEGGVPVKVKSYFISDEELVATAQLASDLRSEASVRSAEA